MIRDQQIHSSLRAAISLGGRFYDVSNSPIESAGPKSAKFGEVPPYILVVDQFKGKQPLIYDERILSGERSFDFLIQSSLILDSHIVTYLHRYFIGQIAEEKQFISSEYKLLKYLAFTKCDFNPAYYMLEASCKSSIENFRRHVPLCLSSILALQSMDEDHFFSSSEIRLKKDAVQFYLDKYRASNFEEAARNWTEQYLVDEEYISMRQRFNKGIDFGYAALLKMVLIHKLQSGNPLEKLQHLFAFMVDELGVVYGLESRLAAYYFYDKLGQLISIEKTTLFVKARSRLLSTAWDLLLLRMPSIILATSSPEIMHLGFICTAEKRLAELARLFTVSFVAAYPQTGLTSMPLIEFDMSDLQSRIGKEQAEMLLDFFDKFQGERINSFVPGVKEPTPSADIRQIILALENELAEFCKK